MFFSFRPVFSSSVVGGILAAMLLAPSAAWPQSSLPAATMSGVIHLDRGGHTSGMRVELKNAGGWETLWADVRPDGTFQAATFGPAAQQYILRVRDRDGAVVYDDIVRPDAGPLEIYLNTPKKERPVDGTVSVDELIAPPKKALREFERAQKAARKGDTDRAIRHLQKAIAIHPEFVEAHNSLGVRHMMLGNYEPAAAAFEEALRLRPDSIEPLSNLGLALHGLGRYKDAERLVRHALELRPGAVKSLYALALVLVSEGGHEQEALEILSEIGGEIPEAHLHAATLLSRRADYQAAARNVTAYLKSNETKHRKMAQGWLLNLQARSARTPISAMR